MKTIKFFEILDQWTHPGENVSLSPWRWLFPSGHTQNKTLENWIWAESHFHHMISQRRPSSLARSTYCISMESRFSFLSSSPRRWPRPDDQREAEADSSYIHHIGDSLDRNSHLSLWLLGVEGSIYLLIERTHATRDVVEEHRERRQDLFFFWKKCRID